MKLNRKEYDLIYDAFQYMEFKMSKDQKRLAEQILDSAFYRDTETEKKGACASFSTVTQARFPFHFIKKYNCPLTSNRVSYIIRSFHIVEPAGFSTFPQHPCGKPEDGRAMRPKRSLACA